MRVAAIGKLCRWVISDISRCVNLSQRIVLGVAAVFIAVIILFPPWNYVYSFPGEHLYQRPFPAERSERPAGYHWLFGQHIPTDITYLTWMFDIKPNVEYQGVTVVQFNRLEYFSLKIDKDRLWIQLGGVLVITLLLGFLLKTRK